MIRRLCLCCVLGDPQIGQMIRRLCLCCVELADHVDPQEENVDPRASYGSS